MLRQPPTVASILQSNYSNNDRKIVSLPLEFGYLPVDILAKQFTKLNSPHTLRIHYLGPRFTNTLSLHKKYGYSETSKQCHGVAHRAIEKYKIDVKRIVTSFSVNEKLRTNHYYKTGIYYRAFQGMNPTLETKNQYIFNGAFQSGNLDCVIQYKPRQFDCFMRIDSNTRGHVQWYYFSVQNGGKKQNVKINICNITKPGTLYEQGMQPYFFSKKSFSQKKTSWAQGNPNMKNVKFEQKSFNYHILEGKIPEKSTYCLSFEYQFQFENDQVFFSYCIPYTYSEMLNDINNLPKNNCEIINFTKSLAGVNIPLLYITEHAKPECRSEKRNIFITGRIHPAESNGSLMLKGFIEYLCSNQKKAIQIRKRTNFYVVPMINPDGVIIGNSRSSAAGKDLNRIFPIADKQIFPQIFQLKHLISTFLNHQQILLYLDFHGHSRRKNTFLYGPSYSLTNPNYYKCRVLPKIIQSLNSSFRYYSCSFSISESKKTTGRACMFENYLIPFTYTVESSVGFYYDSQKMKSFSFDTKAWIDMGISLGEGTAIFVQAYDEYQAFLNERKTIREKKKSQRLRVSRNSFRKDKQVKFFEDLQQCSPENKQQQPLKIYYKNKEECLFMKIFNQIKNPQPQKIVDGQQCNQPEDQASSDDHDQNQDLELTTIKQFNKLIIESCKNDIKHQNIQEGQRGNTNNFIRSGKIGTNKIRQNKNYLDQNEEELNLFEQVIIRKTNSSHSNQRPSKYSPIKLTSDSSKGDRRIAKMSTYENQHEARQKIKQQSQGLLNLSVKNRFNEQKINSARIRGFQGINKTYHIQRKSQYYKMTQFSQLQFPQQTPHAFEDPKKSTKDSRVDIFKRTRKVRNKQQKQSARSINCTEMKVTKLDKSLNKKQTPINNHIDLKIDQLMSNLQNRSKMLKQSVKCRQPQKIKEKNNTTMMFPSSFYGIKNQVNSKRRQFRTYDKARLSIEKDRIIGRILMDQSPFGIRHYLNK